MEDKLKLDFFGEEIIIPIQKDLASIWNIISDKFCLSLSDAKELILYFKIENKKIKIEKDDDYKLFLKEKNKKIFLDISQNSQIFQKNLEELKKCEISEELEKLYKKREELKNIKSSKFEKELKDIHEIKKEIKKLKLKMKKLKKYINIEEKKIDKYYEDNEQKITELENKLGIKKDEEPPKPILLHKKCKTKKKKLIYKNSYQKNSFMENINKIMEEKKQELDNYANSIKENLSNSLSLKKEFI